MRSLHSFRADMWPGKVSTGELAWQACQAETWPKEVGVGTANDSQVCVPAPTLSMATTEGAALLLQLTADPALGRSRAAILTKAGFDVITASEGNAPAYLGEDGIAVMLFCQTTPIETALRLAASTRNRTTAALTARLSFTQLLDEPHFDFVLTAPVAPADLVRAAVDWKRVYLSGVRSFRREALERKCGSS